MYSIRRSLDEINSGEFEKYEIVGFEHFSIFYARDHHRYSRRDQPDWRLRHVNRTYQNRSYHDT